MTITRHHVDQRMSQIVQHGSLIYLAGQCGTAGQSVADQTAESLSKIDRHLAEVGSDKTKLLQVVIWLSDIADFEEMNAVWDQWVPPGAPAARACVETRLAGSGYDVEIIVTATI